MPCVGNLAGRIRVEEFNDAIARQTFINHALAIAVKCSNALSVYPASSISHGFPCSQLNLTNSGNAPPMGARLWLNMSQSAINALSIPEWKKVLLRTLNQYGAIIMDTDTGIFFLSWMTESGNQYISTGATDLWSQFGASRVAEGASDWFLNDITLPDSQFPGYTGTFHDTDDGINWNHRCLEQPGRTGRVRLAGELQAATMIVRKPAGPKGHRRLRACSRGPRCTE